MRLMCLLMDSCLCCWWELEEVLTIRRGTVGQILGAGIDDHREAHTATCYRNHLGVVFEVWRACSHGKARTKFGVGRIVERAKRRTHRCTRVLLQWGEISVRRCRRLTCDLVREQQVCGDGEG